MQKVPFSLERLFVFLFVGAVLFLSYMAGSLTTYHKMFPYSWIKHADQSYRATKEQQKELEEVENEPPIQKADKNPITINKPGAYRGYILFPTPTDSGIKLLDPDGKEVHQWNRPYSTLGRDKTSHTVSDNLISGRDMRLFPNGDLILVHEAWHDTPYGYGISKLDKDSNLIWDYKGNAHHRFDIGEDGNIYVLTQEIDKDLSFPGIEFKDKVAMHEYLVMLSPKGKELRKVSLFKALYDSDFRDELKKAAQAGVSKNDDGQSGVLHSNSVMVLTQSMVSHFPMFKAGEVLISLRDRNALIVLNVESAKVRWWVTGTWKMQHDAEFVDDGTILLYDNMGDKKKRSRILKYNPQTGDVKQVFAGSKDYRFYNQYWGMQQQLPNGNIGIVSPFKRSAFEITPDGQIVWEFKSPFSGGGKRSYLSTLKKIPPEDVKFLQ